MMLLGLALAAQTVTLETNTREAALTCGAAIFATDSSRSVEGLVVATWFSLTSAKDSGPPETTIDRSTEDLSLMGDRVEKIGKNGPELLKQCRTRFPQAWKTSGVILPTNDYDRRVMCFSVGTMLSAYTERDDPAKAKQYMDRYTKLVNDADLEQRGLDDEAGFKKEVGRIFTMSLPLGNFQGVINACAAAFPA